MSDVSDNDATDASDNGELSSDAEFPSQSHLEQDIDSEPGSDSGSDENEDEESHGDARGLLDLEASESDDEEDEDDDDNESDRSSAIGKRTDGLMDGNETITFWTDYEFPQFAKLPPELRCRVWELFSPMICAESRIVTVDLRMIEGSLRVDPEFTLGLQYESVATLLQINHESRDIVLKALPDTLAVCDDDCSLVRFNRSKDVVGLVNLDGWEDCMEPDPLRPENAQHYQISGFSENVEHLSIHDVFLDERGAITNQLNDLGNPAHIFGLLMTFPNLKAVYEVKSSNKLPMTSMHWCGQEDSTGTYDLRHQEENEYGVETETRLIYVWPKIDKFEFPDSRDNLPEVKDLGVWADEFLEDNPPEMPPNFGDSDGDFEFPLMISEVLAGIEMWPMVLFRCGAGYRRLQKLKETKFEDLDDEEEVEPDSDAEDWADMDDAREDLESEDDDGEMDDFIEQDDFDQDAPSDPPQDGGWDDENSEDVDEDDLDLGDEEGAPLFNGFSPTQDSSGADTDNGGDDDGNGALLEPDDGDNSVRPSNKRKARRVVDSDDEEDEDEDIRPVKIQRRSRRAVAPDSEDDDEDGQSDSDDAPVRDAESQNSQPDGSASEDGPDSEDEGEAGNRGRNLTFAERLSLHRNDNPIDSDGASNSNGPESSDDATDHIASDDDSGEDDDGSSNGMADHYAEDMGADEENGSDDDGGW
ncbi:hypothetical protein PspLS_00671 [Pyricularia sp. CBS 133598]|nr:hypothetical protein PspLS_00671 [Pyricularia sp. CBS 133598]